jgi:hypothetical protein
MRAQLALGSTIPVILQHCRRLAPQAPSRRRKKASPRDDALHKECARRDVRVVSALTKSRNWNTQYTGGPLSTLRRSRPFGFLRLSLFGHVIAPDVIQKAQSTANRQRGPYDLDVGGG